MELVPKMMLCGGKEGGREVRGGKEVSGRGKRNERRAGLEGKEGRGQKGVKGYHNK